jgi:hypothetical protein
MMSFNRLNFFLSAVKHNKFGKWNYLEFGLLSKFPVILAMVLQVRHALGHPKPPTFLWPLQSVKYVCYCSRNIGSFDNVCQLIN